MQEVQSFRDKATREHQCACVCCHAVASITQAVFPEGTPGTAIDTLARLPLWRDGLNYRHGTGER
jgi:Xaa-Pro aminopeptidase